jgi:chromosome segregation ATPase
MTDCIHARAQHMKLEEEVRDFHRIARSWRYASLPEDDKTRLNAQIADIELRCEDKKKTLNASVARLVEADSWPVGQRSQVQDDVEDKYREVVRYVEELKNTATEMNNVLNDIREVKIEQRNNAGIPMDVDWQEGQSRPLKRPRVSDDLDDEGSRAPRQYQPTSEEVEEIREKLLAIEGRLCNFENDLIAHDEDLKDELDGLLEAKFEELHKGESLLDTPQSNGVGQSGKFLEVERNINTTGEQVGELAEEVGNLILRSSAVDSDIERLRRENEQFKQDFVLVPIHFSWYNNITHVSSFPHFRCNNDYKHTQMRERKT